MELKQLEIRQPKLCFNPPLPRTPTSHLYTQCLYLFPNSNLYLFSPLRNVQAQYRRWDSNAESFRAQNFNFNPEPNKNDDEDDEAGQWLEVLEELIDGAWIFPVFRSFGWTLPAIISSLLITSGPKAFLMALAVPLGQSVLSLAFQKIVGKKSKPKRKARTRRKPRTRPARNVRFEEEEEEEEEAKEGSRNDSMGYQTWVGGNDIRDDSDSQSSPRFGGWDDLDRQSKSYKGSDKNFAQNTDRPQRSKLSRGRRKGETPLLLRLLIAVFPFLGSWTKIL
ncbi:hypothetical protein ACET3Z_032700 [Daucus carota]